ncbi:MAG: hypothetical protein ACJAY2_003753 [Pseudomonadales bacterium]|jgi:hypothetical protein
MPWSGGTDTSIFGNVSAVAQFELKEAVADEQATAHNDEQAGTLSQGILQSSS